MNWASFTYLVWAALALAAVAAELLARRASSSQLTIAGVLRAIRSHRVGHVVMVLAWMWVGWHVFAR